MTAPSLSIVIPAFDESTVIRRTLEEISVYFDATGLSYELVVVDDGSDDETVAIVKAFAASHGAVRLLVNESNMGKGAAVRRGVLDAKGEDVIAFIDADLPYRLQNLGDAIALVQSSGADIAIGGRDLESSESDPSYPWLRRLMGRSFALVVRLFLVRDIPDTQCGLKAFRRGVAKNLFGEARLDGFGFDFEVLFLARRYGYRIRRIPVAMSHRHQSKVRLVRDSLRMLFDVARVRLNEQRMTYRLPRRCPVCFSSEVWTRTQIRDHVVRECNRCKCRYLSEFPSDEELQNLYEEEYFRSRNDRDVGYASRDPDAATRKTNEKRLSILRRHTPPQSRVLEVGAGNGLFGEIIAREYEYVGIDLSDSGARDARARGLEVYRVGLDEFVSTGGNFDAVTLFHVFEHLRDPQSALDRIHDLLKPGGHLLLITPDTESLLCAVSGDRWVSYKFPEHLILYSRSALIELLEAAGFEVVSAESDSEYCEHGFLLSRLQQLSPIVSALAKPALRALPNPIAVNSGSIRIVAKRRAGPPVGLTRIRTVEPTHAR